LDLIWKLEKEIIGCRYDPIARQGYAESVNRTPPADIPGVMYINVHYTAGCFTLNNFEHPLKLSAKRALSLTICTFW
jgi:hypothetical protein